MSGTIFIMSKSLGWAERSTRKWPIKMTALLTAFRLLLSVFESDFQFDIPIVVIFTVGAQTTHRKGCAIGADVKPSSGAS